MKKILITVCLLCVGIFIGLTVGKLDFVSKRMTSENNMAVNQSQAEKPPLYWVAPMDPNFRSDEPGMSPMGMELIPVYDDGSDEMASTVTISPEVINNLGVRTTAAHRGSLARKVNTVGYIAYDETRISHMHTRTQGWIEKLSVRAEGEKVNKAQLLFELYAPTLVNAQEEYLQALNGENKYLLQASVERLQALGISSSQVTRLQSERKVAQFVKFYAPQSGVISRLNVREGMFIKPDTEVMSLANLDQVWLLAEVFERQANWIKTGQTAEARLPSLPNRVWSGKVEYIYPDLDPVTRTLRVRLKFDNSERLLLPNMYAHVEISGEPKLDVLSIPREAVIRSAKSTRVIIALGEGRFQAREITNGIESDNSIEVLSGLEQHEKVVVSSQFLIDSEASLRASLNRLESVPEEMPEMSAAEEHIHDQ